MRHALDIDTLSFLHGGRWKTRALPCFGPRQKELTMAKRRDLEFTSLDEVMPEVERLLAGHVTVGAWSLGQICHHLATAIRLTLDAPIRQRETTRDQDVARRLFFRSGKFPDGMQAPIAALVPPADRDAHTEADGLRAELQRFLKADGRLPAHPRLGPMTKDEWTQFHCMHCAHHLGFAVPR
jgi:hypothetical protein